MDETHVKEFDLAEHGKKFFDEINKFREEKYMNDGNIVFASEGNVISIKNVAKMDLFQVKESESAY